MRKSLADDICSSVKAARGYRSCQVPNSRPIVVIVDDDKPVGNAIEVLLRSIGLVARAFSSGEEFLRSPELSSTGCWVVAFDMAKMSDRDLPTDLCALGSSDWTRHAGRSCRRMLLVPLIVVAAARGSAQSSALR